MTVYDVLLHLIERLLPDGQEKHALVEEVKKLQAQTEKKESKASGSSKQ